MEWADEGVVLAARKHGESAVIATLLTPSHGRHAGLVRGGAGRRLRGTLQVGNRLRVVWRARLPEHLGSFSCELIEAYSATLLDDGPRLAGLTAAAAVLERALPEREPEAEIYAGFDALLDDIAHQPEWPAAYVRWEIDLLGKLGFGLDLAACAVTGRGDDLVYVSPRSGRAVNRDAAGEYRDRLLPLPPFLTDTAREGAPTAGDIAAGLTLSGYFLERHVLHTASGARTPAARIRLLDIFRRETTKSSSMAAP